MKRTFQPNSNVRFIITPPEKQKKPPEAAAGSLWSPDLLEDYERAGEEEREYLRRRYGTPAALPGKG